MCFLSLHGKNKTNTIKEMKEKHKLLLRIKYSTVIKEIQITSIICIICNKRNTDYIYFKVLFFLAATLAKKEKIRQFDRSLFWQG